MLSSSGDGNLSNLAAAATGTKPTVAEPTEKVKQHIIDRAAKWLAVGAAVIFVTLVVTGLDQLAEMLEHGEIWLIAGLATTLSIGVSAVIFIVWLSPKIEDMNRDLADVAEAIAAGDLSQRPKVAADGGQIGRLGRAMVVMSEELKRLANLIRDNAAETARRSTEITGGTEHMATAASGIAETASVLSMQATDMADTIRLLSLDAGRLNSLSTNIAAGAAEGIERNERLKALATESHEQLDESARRLDVLVSDVQASARATESLATASDQIRGFVVLVQKIARQSKLLALNAAMEAARAGEQGEGFTVVANEVRRLAQGAAEAAEHTHQLMQELIAQMEIARQTSARSLTTVETVRAATQHGRQAFTQVEVTVDAADQWIGTMASAAQAGSTLAAEITTKLDSLSAGTQSFASAMHDVAAASQEQSASTEEIAAASSALMAAAERVSHAAKQFGARS